MQWKRLQYCMQQPAAHWYGRKWMPDRLDILAELERKVLWLSSWTIHNANHLRESDDGLKIGGHQASSASLATIMTALYFARAQAAGSGRGEAARRSGLPRDPVPARQPVARQAARHSAPSRVRRAIRRGPRTSTTSTSRPARSGSALRRPCLRRSSRTMSGRTPERLPCRKAAWWRWSATPKWTRATFSRPCSKAGSRACATPGGSSTTTARASTRWSAKGCGSVSRRCSAISAGTSSSSNTGRCRRRLSPSRAAKRCAAGSTAVRTSSIRR